MRSMKVCAVCRATWSQKAWTTLPLVQVIEAAEAQKHLTVPMDDRIEVRSCRCGASLAAVAS
jgi:hypothetical protein